MSAPRDPAALAKTIAAKDPDLRALLLRLADGEEWRDTPTGVGPRLCNRPLAAARRTGLAAFPEGMEGMWAMLQLTPTGREVAEHCRPPKWTAARERGGSGGHVVIDKPDGEVDFISAWENQPGSRDLRDAFDRAQRVVDLLNADDLARAKIYGAKP